MKSFIKFFSSVKLAIFLLITITLASILGTLIPQHRSPEEYAAHYGQLAELFSRLQLTKLYKSSWFVTLLIFLSLNIVVCTLTRLEPKVKKLFNPRFEKDTKKLIGLKIAAHFKKPWPIKNTTEALVKLIRSYHYRCKKKNENNQTFILARKKVLGRFGSDIVHIGLLVILTGGIISGVGNLRQNLTLAEGQTVSVPRAEFKIKLDKFETEYYPNGSVKDWKSTLTVIENEKPALTKTIEVNNPLSYNGYVFYQSSYGWDWKNPQVEIWVKKKSDPSFLKKIRTKLGKKVALDDDNIEIIALHFIPDFVINEQNEIATRSLEPRNPAAFIQGWQGSEQIFSGWIFAHFPDFSRIHSSKETDLNFELKDFQASQFSVIQAAKDPGVTFIWIGSSLLMAGLFLAFYWPSREIKFILKEDNGQTAITAGGIAAKNKENFQSEFEKIMTALRRSK